MGRGEGVGAACYGVAGVVFGPNMEVGNHLISRLHVEKVPVKSHFKPSSLRYGHFLVLDALRLQWDPNAAPSDSERNG